MFEYDAADGVIFRAATRRDANANAEAQEHVQLPQEANRALPIPTWPDNVVGLKFLSVSGETLEETIKGSTFVTR